MKDRDVDALIGRLASVWPPHWPEDRRAMARASVIAGVLGVATFASHTWVRHREEAERTQLINVLGAPAALPHEQQATSARGAIRDLPASPRTARLINDLTSWSAESGLLLHSLVSQQGIASATSIPRVDVTITVAGAYPQIKLLLREILARYQEVAIKSLDLRRVSDDPAASQVMAEIELRLYSMPVQLKEATRQDL